MSKRESKKRLKRRSKAYRKAMIVINVFFTLTIIVFSVVGITHTFTHKKEYYNQGISLYEQGDYEQAITYFDKAYDAKQWFAEKMNADIMLYKAECQSKLGNYEDAIKTYRKLINIAGENAGGADINSLININQSLILFECNNYLEAVTGFEKAYEDGNSEFLLYIGICYENIQDYEKMHHYYNLYQAAYGKSAFTDYKNATYYLINKDYDTALGYIKSGIGFGDSEYLKKLEYAEIFCYEKKYDYSRAYTLCTEYMKKYPSDEEGALMLSYLDTRVNIATDTVLDE